MHKFNIDKFIINENQLYLSGWGFIEGDQLDSLAIRIYLKNTRVLELNIKHSIVRDDVATAFQQEVCALNSGFFMLTGLDVDSEVVAASLYWNFNKNGVIINELIEKKIEKLSVRQNTYANFIHLISSISNKYNNYSKLHQLKKILGNRSVAIIIDHNMGGGANIFRNEYISNIGNINHIVTLLTFDVNSLQYLIKIYYKDSVIYEDYFNTLDSFFILLSHKDIRKIVYNCAVSFRAVFCLIDSLKKLLDQTNCHLIIMVHDHFIICPSYFLLNQDGQYCGIPSLSVCDNCLSNHPDPFLLFSGNHEIEQWRLKWLELIEKADEVRTFSNFSKDLVLKAFPVLKDNQKLTILPHKLHTIMYTPVLNKGECLHIGIVGSISKHKGADIVTNIASYIAKYNLNIKITIFGVLESNSINGNITILGSYDPFNLGNLIENSGANIFLLSSICPETFSYVAHELVAMSIPFACFNFGAPSDLANRYNKGRVLYSMDANYIVDELINFWHKIYA